MLSVIGQGIKVLVSNRFTFPISVVVRRTDLIHVCIHVSYSLQLYTVKRRAGCNFISVSKRALLKLHSKIVERIM